MPGRDKGKLRFVDGIRLIRHRNPEFGETVEFD